jgi:hypothetical protein
MVGFLNSAATLLSPTGTTVLAIPDKRFCFDFFRPLTSTGSVLAAHNSQRTRHSKAALFDYVAWYALGDGQYAWPNRRVSQFSFAHTLELGHWVFNFAGDDDASPYTDAHGWVLTPASFQLLILELARLQVIDWEISRTEPGTGEFFVWLRRGGAERAGLTSEADINAQRLDLFRRILMETKEQISLLLDSL